LLLELIELQRGGDGVRGAAAEAALVVDRRAQAAKIDFRR
jgi:hypothetical protein